MSDRRHASLSAIGIAALFCLGFAPMATADGHPDTGQLGVQWWQQVASIPAPLNPFLDETGANCGIGQRGNTWFLYTSHPGFGPLVELDCTIPAGTSIFLELIPVICIPLAGQTLEQMVEFCKELSDLTKTRHIRIDGVERNELIKRRVDGSFTLAIPDDNIFGEPRSIVTAVHDGYFALIPPLAPGQHTIRVTAKATDGFVNYTRWHINIVKPAKTLPTAPLTAKKSTSRRM